MSLFHIIQSSIIHIFPGLYYPFFLLSFSFFSDLSFFIYNTIYNIFFISLSLPQFIYSSFPQLYSTFFSFSFLPSPLSLALLNHSVLNHTSPSSIHHAATYKSFFLYCLIYLPPHFFRLILPHITSCLSVLPLSHDLSCCHGLCGGAPCPASARSSAVTPVKFRGENPSLGKKSGSELKPTSYILQLTLSGHARRVPREASQPVPSSFSSIWSL